MKPPVGQVSVHERQKSIAVIPLDEVSQFVDNQVIEALHRLFCEFEVEPDATGVDVAASPLRFHLFDAPFSHINTQHWLPFLDEWRNQVSQFGSVPALQNSLALLSAQLR